MWVEPTSGCLSDDALGQPERIGQGETGRHAKPVDVTKKVGTSVNPADFMTKPMPRPKIGQLMSIFMGYEFVGQSWREQELHGMRLVGGLTDVQEKG